MLNDRITISKTCYTLFLVTLFVFSIIGLGLIPTVHALENYDHNISNETDLSMKYPQNEQHLISFNINGEPLTWYDFKINPNMSLSITNKVGAMSFRVVVGDSFSSQISSIQINSAYGVKFNWEYIENNLSDLIPEDLGTPFLVRFESYGREITYDLENYRPAKVDLQILVANTSAFISNIIGILFDTIASHPLLIFIYSIAFVGLMFWLFTIFRV